MRDRTARFDRVIRSSAPKMAVRVDVLFDRQTIITGLNVVSGEITFDRTAMIMARGSLRLAEPTRLPTITDGGPLSPYGYELQIWRGLKYADGTTELLAQGVCPIQKSSFDGATLVADVEFLDRAKLVIDAKFEEDYQVVAGANIGTTIQAIIDAGVPGLTYAFQSTTYTTPRVTFSASDDRWEAAKELAKSIGCELFFDGYGRCVMRAEPGASTEPVWAISEGDGGALQAIGLDLDREPARNRWIVTGENSTNTLVYRGVATDDDPASPTAYDGPFGRKPGWYASEYISSDDQAATVAAALLTATSGVARSLQVTAVPNPALEPGDVIETQQAALGISELYIIDGYTLGLGADQLMGWGVAL